MFNWFKKNKNNDEHVNFEEAEMFFIDELYAKERLMPLKEMFLNYVERQRCANATKDAYGPHDGKTKEAYEEANEYKRKVLDLIEKIEEK